MRMTPSSTSTQNESDTSPQPLIIQVNLNLISSQGLPNTEQQVRTACSDFDGPCIQPNNSYSDLCQSRLKFMVDIPLDLIPDSYFTSKLFEHLEVRLKLSIFMAKIIIIVPRYKSIMSHVPVNLQTLTTFSQTSLHQK